MSHITLAGLTGQGTERVSAVARRSCVSWVGLRAARLREVDQQTAWRGRYGDQGHVGGDIVHPPAGTQRRVLPIRLGQSAEQLRNGQPLTGYHLPALFGAHARSGAHDAPLESTFDQ